MSDYETLLIDRVARITLNRPEKLNVLSQKLMFELKETLDWRDGPYRDYRAQD